MTEKKALITSLIRTVEAVQERASKLLTLVKDFPDDGDVDELEDKLDVVDDLRTQFRETRLKLFGLVKQDDLPEINDQGFNVEDTLDEIRFIVRRRLKVSRPSLPETSTSSVTIPPIDPCASKARLPDIPLPKFDGHYENWLYFRNQFNAIIRRRDNLDDFERLHYLRMCLCGEARDLQCDEETFTSLWNALIRRYENKRWLIEKHLGDLFRISALTSENATALRTMIDGFLKHIRALSALGFELDKMSEIIFVQMVMMRLDQKTRRAYEADLGETEVPSWSELVNFLGNHCRMLENLECLSKSCVMPQGNRRINTPMGNQRYPSNNRSLAATVTRDRSKISCFLCQQNHYINQCETFLNLTPGQRSDKIKSLSLCFNCLSHNHTASQCTRSSCRVCQKRHHTLLHLETSSSSIDPRPSNRSKLATSSVSNSSVSQPPLYASQLNRTVSIKRQVLLNTAIVYVEDSFKELHKVRLLLDSGSMCNFITENCVQRLSLKKMKGGAHVTGVCGSSSTIQHKVCAIIRSTTSDFETEIECLVTPKITAKLPLEIFESEALSIPDNLVLADPTFNIPDRIDVLLGMDIYANVLESNRVPLLNGSPVMQETALGWVIGGNVEVKKPLVAAFVTNENLDNSLRRFWEIENCSAQSKFTMEENAAEQHFMQTFYRKEDGRYVVELPFKTGCPNLGDSKQMALKRLLSLEKRLSKNWLLAKDYSEFINEYVALGHMHRICSLQNYTALLGNDYFLPHHAVERPESSTTKCRVVFDGSAVTTNGRSLNDNLLVGPVIQPKLSDVLIRFRVYKIAFTAGLSKMYRQVALADKHQSFQQILWRDNEAMEPDVYRLSTVTYGLASAPFQAVRAVKQLCLDEEKKISTCSKDRDEGFIYRRYFICGKFDLHKWCSNSSEFLNQLPQDEIEQKLLADEESAVKALGIIWKPEADVFMFNVNPITSIRHEATKRSVLSDISKFFDPIGLAGPVILVAKLMMQNLWRKDTNWDDEIDREDMNKWVQFKSQLDQLRDIKLKRCVFPLSNAKIQIHGFCDASKYAYGSCIYVRSVDEGGHVHVSLVCSKSCVAPLERSKKRKTSNANMTIPKLELCGALLLAELVTEVVRSLQIHIDKTYLWCDSTIALSWIARNPDQSKQFVSNRVTKIQALTNTMRWCHVGTNDNPADIVSRGLMPKEFRESKMWWDGPEFLQLSEPMWPHECREPENVPELKSVVLLSKEPPKESFSIFQNCSSYRRMIRVMVYVQRFISIMKNRSDVPRSESMSREEVKSALQQLVKLVQGTLNLSASGSM
ncbi:uncharacterized protein LOC131429118 [Malaya genurostris]|uniref:uncharacterized protein LOC131429118 n=1 Tax=Malaya genurostris TaxID=325434 RepID=UPI0026F3D775|nr:uncharacterized protein LOC131429118 [Malaya genurostris]